MADSKISALAAIDALAADDLLPVVDDPSGTPVNKKATLTQIFALLQSMASLAFSNAVQFASIELGHASDTTIARAAAGAITVEGKGVWRVLASSNVATPRNSVNGAGDATEATLVTVTVPAGAMGPNGLLRITTVWTYTNSANNKNIRVRLGAASAGLSGTSYLAVTQTTSASFRDQRQIGNRNAQNSQVGGFAGSTAFTQGSAANVTSAVDTSAASELVFTTAWGGATSGETITLESYLVEILYGA